eukprot:401970_1
METSGNSRSNTQCICCNKHIDNDALIDTSNKYISPNCLQYHFYCTTCALTIINQSLSLYNQAPKCIVSTCNQPFNISSSKIINSKLFEQYDVNIKQYNHDKYLLYAYIRQNKNNIKLFPVDIIELINSFYKLILITKMSCDNCYNSTYNKQIECNKCESNGYLYRISLKKIISTQKRCALCNQYCSSSKIIYWNGCNHTYCHKCMLIDLKYIEEKIRFDRIPQCNVSGCKKELTKQSLELIYLFFKSPGTDIMKVYYATKLDMMHKSKIYFECELCNCWHTKEYMFMLSNCGCKGTKQCIKKLIENTVSTLIVQCKCGTAIDMNDMILSGYWDDTYYDMWNYNTLNNITTSIVRHESNSYQISDGYVTNEWLCD